MVKIENKWYIGAAYKDSEKPKHIHNTMFVLGEIYHVQKMDSEFSKVKGKFKNSLGGTEYKEQSMKISILEKHIMLAHYDEQMIYPRYVTKFDEHDKSHDSSCDLYEEHKNKPIGTKCVSYADAPGIGKTVEVITKITKEGIYGILIINTIRTMDKNDVI